jgi:hypothetical protein
LLAEAGDGYFVGLAGRFFGLAAKRGKPGVAGKEQRGKELSFFETTRDAFFFQSHKLVMRTIMIMRTIVNKYF